MSPVTIRDCHLSPTLIFVKWSNVWYKQKVKCADGKCSAYLHTWLDCEQSLLRRKEGTADNTLKDNGNTKFYYLNTKNV
jgi:hypothetical protein